MPNILSYLSLDFEYFSANMLFFFNFVIKAGKGWNTNDTIVFVNQSVNWYSAVKTFGKDFSRTIRTMKAVHDTVLNLLNASQYVVFIMSLN